MSYCIIIVAGKVISCVNVQQLTEAYQATDEYLLQLNFFNELLANIIYAKEKEVNIAEVPERKRLSIYDYETKFF